MKVLTNAIVEILRRLPPRADARRMISIMPLGSIFWEDEMPDRLDKAKLSREEWDTILQLFVIRYKVWDGRVLSPDDQAFWDAARAEVPTWALFHRLVLTAEDQEARKQDEAYAREEFEDMFAGAELGKVTDIGHGLASVEFDLTKETRAVKPN